MIHYFSSLRSLSVARADSAQTLAKLTTDLIKNIDPVPLSGLKEGGGGQIERWCDSIFWRAIYDCFSLAKVRERSMLTEAKVPELAEHWQPSHQSHEADLIRGRMAERDLPPENLPLQPSSDVLSSDRQNSSDENGHADSPDETLSPTSVIYFKEALNSSNLRFGKPELSPTPIRQYDFRIERIDSKRRSKW